MAEVVLDKVNKQYENGFHAVQDLDLDIAHGEFLVLVGPSGCGKSTALRMVAGLEDITSGTMRIGDRVVNTLSPKDRDIAMVFQSYALYPHRSVADNIAYGLRIRRMDKAEIERRVKKVAEMLELGSLLDLLADGRLVHPGQPQREAHVVADGHVRVERVGLEHHRNAAFRRVVLGHILAADEHLPRRQLLETRDRPKQGRLSTPRRADEDHKFAVAYVEVDILDDLDGPKILVHASQLQLSHLSPSSGFTGRVRGGKPVSALVQT